jgi:hypothetical protein
MDIDPSDEAEFNRWYDREHLEERVAIPGFLEARRYIAHQGQPKYLSLYSTETFEVLDSPAYRTALANQTDRSKAVIACFKNMIRAVARITVSRGRGRGATLGVVRLRPSAGDQEKLRVAVQDWGDSDMPDGIISLHLIESDPALSRPLTGDLSAAKSGAGDCFMLIEGTGVNAVSAAIAEHFTGTAAFKPGVVMSRGIYSLIWDLAKSDISSANPG